MRASMRGRGAGRAPERSPKGFCYRLEKEVILNWDFPFDSEGGPDYTPVLSPEEYFGL